METYSIYVEGVTFMMEAEDAESAKQDVEAILWDNAHDWGTVEVS
jgi:hypothetical protein